MNLGRLDGSTEGGCEGAAVVACRQSNEVALRSVSGATIATPLVHCPHPATSRGRHEPPRFIAFIATHTMPTTNDPTWPTHGSARLHAVALAASLLLGGCASLNLPVADASAAPVGGTPAARAPAGQPAATPPVPAPVTQAQTAPGTNPGPAAAPGGAAPPPAPGQPPVFANVIKDAKETKGLFAVWQKDEKTWLELKPEDFDKPFFFSPKLTSGIGEGGIYGGRMFGRWGQFGRSYLVEFRRVHNQVRLVALNNEFTAKPGPEGRAVGASFSPSLLSSTAVASQPHPERKTILVDASPLLLGDILGLGIELQRTYRQGYALDPRHTAIAKARAGDGHVTFEVQAHYASSGIAMPAPGASPPGAPVPTTPGTLPDVRSMFIGIHYSISKLPDTAMVARKADPRVGYFASTSSDFTNDLARTPRQRVVNRWRLEKKDPTAAVSEPVKPITFWIDRTVPVKYRDSITKGILGWNAAFEKAGFKDAMVVKVQPDNADFDTLDVNVASVRWITNAQPVFGAIGPSQVDPRSGEILDADISFESLVSRNLRTFKSQVIASQPDDWGALMQLPRSIAGSGSGHPHPEACDHAEHASEQLGYALDALDLDPASPEAEQFVQDYMVDVTMHEVGHTLGLRHNFRSSKIYTDKQLSDREFTARHGLAGSVMEYAPINLPRPREAGGTPFQTALGPYDYWAIEYGYKPFHPDHEDAELKKISARSAEPQLAYGTDEDNYLGVDPDSLHFDLGDDTVAFARKRIEIANDVLRRQETRSLKGDEDYSVLGRSVSWALRDMARTAGILARQVGGLRMLRDFPNTGRDPLQPVEGRVQREAIDLLATNLFAADAVALSPKLQRQLAPDYFERTDAVFAGATPSTSYAVAPAVIGLQRALLGQLMSDSVATRIIDNASKADPGSSPLMLSQLYGRLTKEIFSDVGGRDDIAPLRRELQRDYVNRLSAQLLRPSAVSRADTRSLLREQARVVLARIEAAKDRRGLSAESRAHLADSAESLRQALDAKLQRQGV